MLFLYFETAGRVDALHCGDSCYPLALVVDG